MKRKSKVCAPPGVACSSYSDARKSIKRFLKSVLSRIGLRARRDYRVTDSCLCIRHLKDVVGRVLVMLKETFPVFSFYWDTPRRLVWF